jgi:hypothetical protein
VEEEVKTTKPKVGTKPLVSAQVETIETVVEKPDA